MKDIYILGINGSHAATAALLKNGEIIACASEERFSRIKNQRGYPEKAIAYCLQEAAIASSVLDGVFIGFERPTLFISAKRYKKNYAIAVLKKTIPFFDSLFWKIIPGYQGFDKFYRNQKQRFRFIGFERQQKSFLMKTLCLPEEKIHTIDHHTAHAYAACYASSFSIQCRGKVLAITCDGEGDGVSSKIFTIENNTWEEIAATAHDQSLGWLYASVTLYLGMKVNEHEYKVMGLAPYARKQEAAAVYTLFKKYMHVDGLSIRCGIPVMSYPLLLEKILKGYRFDAIAGGVQRFTEEILATLVRNAVKKTGIKNIVFGGGVFMNVKANMEIAKLPAVESLFVMPSSGDESTAIGAAYYGYKKYCEKNSIQFRPQPLKQLYLGPSYSEREIVTAIEKLTKKFPPKISAAKLTNPAEEIANFLAQGKIVARFAGRMEYGARALGNRSILANPKDTRLIRIINDQIKGRDFWMPFAAVILKERVKDYLFNSKNLDSPFMMVAFKTTQKAQEDMPAALHPYDYTCRPQILEREQNKAYYDLIKAFEKKTGIGALLNTSFNLHGEPIVCTPEDAIRTFLNSGLEYLQMEKFILKKKN